MPKTTMPEPPARARVSRAVTGFSQNCRGVFAGPLKGAASVGPLAEATSAAGAVLVCGLGALGTECVAVLREPGRRVLLGRKIFLRIGLCRLFRLHGYISLRRSILMRRQGRQQVPTENSKTRRLRWMAPLDSWMAPLDSISFYDGAWTETRREQTARPAIAETVCCGLLR